MKKKLEIPSANDPSFRWVAVGLLVLVELMLYSASLVHSLAADDFIFREFHNRTLSEVWSQPADDHGHWRPLSYSLKYVLFSAFEEAALPWHTLNLVIHLISVLLFFGILRRLSESSEMKGLTGPMLAAFIFQVHPAAVQNVYWASGFSDLVCMLLLLLATFFSISRIQKAKAHFTFLAALSFAAALLAKESAIVFPVFLVLILRLTLGSWQSVLKLHGRLLALLSLLALLFAIFFILISGQIVWQQSGLLAGAWGVFLRGFGMLVIPTDSMRIYQLGLETPLAAAGLCALVIFVLVLLFRKQLLTLTLILLFLLTFLSGFFVYAIGGYISLRLMYSSIGFFVIAVFLLLTRKAWWTGEDPLTRILRWSAVLYAVASFYFSISAVMDWHVADKFAKVMGDSFVTYHLEAKESAYVFGVIPSRLRQAEICGEPSTDFKGILRRNELPDSVRMRSLLRIVLLDREDVSANSILLRNSAKSLIVSTQSENQFFLFGRVDTPHKLPVGTVFEDQSYTVEVLETILDDRAVTVKVTAKDPADLDRLLFFDDQERQFVPLQEIEPVSEDETNE